MKKIKYFALMSAIALTSTIGFTACSSSEDVAEVENNPTYDPVKGTVTSQFVLNIASDTRNNTNSTRSGATTVQAGGENFRGIDNSILLAYVTNGKRFVNATSAAAAAANRYDLGSLVAAGSLDNDGDNSHRILELSVPTGTDALLFYGKAMKGSTSTPDYYEIGKVTYNVANSIATAFSFSLNPHIATTADENRFNYTGELLAAIMTKIISAHGTYTVKTSGEGRIYPDWTGAGTLSSTWKDLNPTTQARALSPLEEILYKAFTKLTTIGATELRGGSSRAIVTTVKDLRAVILTVAGATPTSPYEELAVNIASNINTQINKYFTAEAEGLKAISNIKEEYGTGWDSNWDVIDSRELADFPITTFHLPEGAAILEYIPASNTFSHKTPGTSLLDKATTADPTVYQYPAELMYYCNSGVRTSDKEKTSDGFPNGVANWDTNSKWDSDWKGTTVTSSTRATAMTQNVNYGVAMLMTTVGIKEGLSALQDNRAALNSGETNNSFALSAIDFTLTGIIIGGQPASVNWQFLSTDNTFTKLVYDNRIAGETTGTAVPKTAGGTSAPNYTILFDNYTTSATQNKVRVALQFVNNGDDFWGRDNLIRKGQTFYLVGELDPTGKTIPTENWDSYYQVPPLDASGVSTKTTRVFVQDYMTTANFKIAATSLQNAFVTLPDLRSSQLSFGLSVDLDWRPGLAFAVDLGGN